MRIHKDNIRLFRELTIIILLLIAIDIIVGYTFQFLLNHIKDGRYFKLNYSYYESNEDIIIIGSSRAEMDYNPNQIHKETGLSCWNAGRGGQGLIYFYSLETEILDRYTPKLIILNVDPNMLSGDLEYDKAAILRPFAKKNSLLANLMIEKDLWEKLKLRSYMYSYNSSIFYLVRPLFQKDKDGKKADKGWKPKYGKIPESQLKALEWVKKEKPKLENIELNPRKIAIFNKMVELAEQKKCNLVFAIPPDFDFQVITPTLKYVEKMSKNKNIPIFNFRSDHELIDNISNFSDLSHLNYVGANKFSKKLAENISQLFIINNNE
jgi:hypothetical protein